MSRSSFRVLRAARGHFDEGECAGPPVGGPHRAGAGGDPMAAHDGGILDEACHRLLEAVKRRGVRRLFIDGLEGFERLTTDRERLGHVFAALSNELSALGVTTLYTAEAEAIGPVSGLPLSHVPLQGVSCIAEIIVVMRYVELRAHLHRVIAVLKVRNALIDSAFHKFTITNTGIVIDEDASAAEKILAEAAGQAELSRFRMRAGRGG